MRNNYDRVAGYYDRLSRLVFGKALVRAQQDLIPHLQAPGRLLIIGGGTGWILEEIARLHPTGLAIDYVEISENMLSLSRKRNVAGNKVRFVHSAIENFTTPHRYEAVITPFLFDNFSTERAEAVFQQLHQVLLPQGQWLFADFNIEKSGNAWWQKLLLRSMYTFFRTLSHVEARQLPDMPRLFAMHGYEICDAHYHFGRFIRSAVYRQIKPAPPGSA